MIKLNSFICTRYHIVNVNYIDYEIVINSFHEGIFKIKLQVSFKKNHLKPIPTSYIDLLLLEEHCTDIFIDKRLPSLLRATTNEYDDKSQTFDAIKRLLVGQINYIRDGRLNALQCGHHT